MRTLHMPIPLFMLLFVTACVTINVYFPAEAAEKAADRIILDVYGKTPPQAPQEKPAEPQSMNGVPGPASRALAVVLDWLVSPAGP